MISELRKFKWAEPFRPFEIELDDGRRIIVRQRLHVGWSDQYLMFSVSDEAGDHVQMKRVVAVRPYRRGKSNQRGRRRR